ncbi:MAG: hypothetical protein ACYC6X_00100 [Minisyncoccota bacterium]
MKDALIDVDRVKPRRKICEINVEVPTIIIEPFFKGGKSMIFVQWFAEFSSIVPTKHKFLDTFVKKFQRMQFRFPVLVSLKDECWMGRPDLFRVVMLGQISDLLWETGVPDSYEKDDWISSVVSSHYGVKTRDWEGPVSFEIPLKVMSIDQVCCRITPKKYYDTTVLDREKKVFEWQELGVPEKRLNG